MLPSARLGSGLAVALYILFASAAHFGEWQTVDDAVESMQHVKAQSDAAPSEGGPNLNPAAGTETSMPHVEGVAVADACKWLPAPALDALSEAVQARAACYPEPCASDRLAAQEARVARSAAGGGAEEGRQTQRAVRAALTLVAEEERLLADCLRVLHEERPAREPPQKKRNAAKR